MSRVKCVVAGAIDVYDPPAKSVERLRHALSLPHPELSRAMARGAPTGSVPDRWHATTEAPWGISVPRGATRALRSALAEDGLEPEFEDRRSRGSELSASAVADLRDYQEQGREALVSKLQGLVILPCGGGKTTLGVAAIAAAGKTALVVVHTEDLLRQWVATVNDKLGIAAGTIGGGKMRLGTVTVAIVDSLLPLLDDLPLFGECFGTVVVDEAHHAPAAQLSRALARLPARYRLGLTATPDREDGLGPAVEWLFGERLLTRTVDDLSARGWLTQPVVEAVKTEFRFDADRLLENKRQAAVSRALAHDHRRNEAIRQIVSADAERGESVLVLTSRKDHVALLACAIGDAAVITGDTGEREETLRKFRAGETRVLIATQLADEGLDIPRLSRIVLAMPERARGKTVQRVGRLMRPHEGKEPKLYDIVDASVPMLLSRWKTRRATYRKMGLLVTGDPA